MLIRTKDILNNKLRISGTRISYETVIRALKKKTVFDVLKDYPTLTIYDIIDCLKYYKERIK